ncbi:uncharacterized protein LOC121887152 isoform X1 [Thunnus maccoyii]|uniref:uncharacterized protein LOC121887152 isoform X1 n=2 Tax=Thunnus maccoyii TaxID=8240 RepID=UPI001C4BC5F2|nr:uncharacterized protein LOC121887152 isoform X1 [Thunnus maccoyii]
MSIPTPTARESPPMAPEPMTVIVASVACIVFCIMILMLVVVLYRKDPLCCRFKPHRTEHYTDNSPHYHSRHSLIGIAHNEHSATMNQGALGPQDNSPHYHSRHSLIGIAHNEHSATMNQGALGPQLPGRVFIIGMPNDYHLSGPLPRLPTYESVRKRDRQRHIHNMIAHRFGLSNCHDELPPTYEETLRQSLDISPADLQSLDVNLSVHTQDRSSQLSDGTYNPSQPSTPLQGFSSSY